MRASGECPGIISQIEEAKKRLSDLSEAAEIEDEDCERMDEALDAIDNALDALEDIVAKKMMEAFWYGRVFYLLSSDEEPVAHVGDILIDCKGNRSVITGVGEATKCFGTRYSFSLMLDGKEERGKIALRRDADES